MEATVAEQCLLNEIDKVISLRRQGVPTLCKWRLENLRIKDALFGFAQSQDWAKDNQTDYEKEVKELFIKLNTLMWEQEVETSKELQKTTVLKQGTCFIIFGGKYSKNPGSISETLIQVLAERYPDCKIFTSSRTVISPADLPGNITHYSKQNCDVEGGDADFCDVLSSAFSHSAEDEEDTSEFVIFFTFGQHVGPNAFSRNIRAAANFCKAIRTLLKGRRFRIVITGTDATYPSTRLDPILKINGESYCVPTYKIGDGNFVYAMSKLCQFYMIAEAVVEVLDANHIKFSVDNLKLIRERISEMQTHITAAGNDGKYHGGSHAGISMAELNEISTEWENLEDKLKSYVHVAKGISICYTPLHAHPWVEQSFGRCLLESHGSPKGYVLQQIVRRFKNSMSTRKAALAHLSL
mmetsp:Transcript_6983/g.7990  ORF Transcript_6983/g.7990 Transcript_6983/m.7990 type:complete len:410 (+) Transcript_6983:1031-2260(+)